MFMRLVTVFVVGQQSRQRHLVDQDLMANESLLSSAGQGDGRMSSDPLLMAVWAYQAAAAFLIVISIVGLVMNILVIIAIVSDRQMTALNWMLLNLACSDGLIAAFGAPVSAFAALQYEWPFSDEFCITYAMIMSSAGIGSITTLTVLALWRCQLVVYCPANRRGAFANNHGGGRCRAVLLLTIIWAYTLAVTCPPLFGWGRYDREASHISCSVNWESKMDNNRLYIIYMFTFALFVPLAIIVVSYVSILRVVRKASQFKKSMMALHSVRHPHELADQQSNSNQQSAISNQQETSKKTDQHKKQKSDAAEKRVTVMVACMVGAFMTAWTPYSILALFETFTNDVGIPSNSNSSSLRSEFHYVGTTSPALATIPSLFAKTSAVFNPLIYGLLNTQFRTAWEKFSVRFLKRRQHRKNKEVRHLLSCLGHKTSTLKPSTSIHLSMKEMVTNQSADVMATKTHTSPPVAPLLHRPMDSRANNPSEPAVGSSLRAGTTSIKILLQQRQKEDVAKSVVVCFTSNSTSCRIADEVALRWTDESVL